MPGTTKTCEINEIVLRGRVGVKRAVFPDTMASVSRFERKLWCFPLFAAGCFLVYFGAGMLFFVPRLSSETFLQDMAEGRFIYGVVPFVLGIILIGMGRLIWPDAGTCH